MQKNDLKRLLEMAKYNIVEKVEMCSDDCCGKPITECVCGPDCEHCDCHAKNNINESYSDDDDNRTVSNCCGADAYIRHNEISVGDTSRCSDCREMAEFIPEKDFFESINEEPILEEGMVSSCCGAPLMSYNNGHGRCSDCKEMASGEEVYESTITEIDHAREYVRVHAPERMLGMNPIKKDAFLADLEKTYPGMRKELGEEVDESTKEINRIKELAGITEDRNDQVFYLMKKSLLRGKWYLENEEMDPEMVSSELRDINNMLNAVEDGIDDISLVGLDTAVDEQYMHLHRQVAAKLKGAVSNIYGVDHDVLPLDAKPNPDSPYNSGQVEESLQSEELSGITESPAQPEVAELISDVFYSNNHYDRDEKMSEMQSDAARLVQSAKNTNDKNIIDGAESVEHFCNHYDSDETRDLLNNELQQLNKLVSGDELELEENEEIRRLKELSGINSAVETVEQNEEKGNE